VLSVRGLTVAFAAGEAEVPVVSGVDFDIGPGETLGIVGESGCGKSVTVRSLLGLLPPGGRISGGSALFGSALFGGRDLATMTERGYQTIRGSKIALIAQDPMNSLDPSFTVGSQLTEVLRHHNRARHNRSRHNRGRSNRVSRATARARVRELLTMVQLPDPDQVARCYPHELSGGMAQRALIAMALAGNPALLIADEPTTALDVTVQAEILALLRDLRDRLGMAIILITHDWGVLADACDRVVVMYAGQVVEQGALDDLYAAPRHPYTEGLLAANPRRATVGEPLPVIGGSVPAPAAWPSGCHFEPRCRYATAACTAGPVPLVPVPVHAGLVGAR
jgi:peptide/nickel transport system permease protein